MLLTHLNHSSVICETKDQLLITDPWLFSNAFESWYQNPYPNIKTVNKIFQSINKPLYILISHAHDDHFDDIFLSKLPNKTFVIIPKTKNNSFKNRVLKCGIEREFIIEADKNGCKVGAFNIACFFDGSLSNEDFIFTISDEETLFIHANDNWREFSEYTISKIKNEIRRISFLDIIFMSQIGIADSFPLFYAGYNDTEKKEIITKKITAMCNAFINNCSRLDLDLGFAYANQSKFSKIYKLDDRTLNFDPYLIKDELIKKNSNRIIQLNPSDEIKKGNHYKANQRQKSLLDARLEFMELALEEYTLNKNLETIPIKMKSFDKLSELNNNNEITIYAPSNIWNSILNGQLNLESIITGGSGLIHKPKGYNMRKEYSLLTNWAYINQIRARDNLNLPIPYFQ